MNHQAKEPGCGKKVAVTTLGCKVNQYDSSALAGKFMMRGYSVVPFNTQADIYVINTCTVTGRSDYQARQLIRRAFRANPAALIAVTGCLRSGCVGGDRGDARSYARRWER